MSEILTSDKVSVDIIMEEISASYTLFTVYFNYVLIIFITRNFQFNFIDEKPSKYYTFQFLSS